MKPSITIEFDAAKVQKLEPGPPWGVPIGGHRQVEVYVVLRDSGSPYVKDDIQVFAVEPDAEIGMLELTVTP